MSKNKQIRAPDQNSIMKHMSRKVQLATKKIVLKKCGQKVLVFVDFHKKAKSKNPCFILRLLIWSTLS